MRLGESCLLSICSQLEAIKRTHRSTHGHQCKLPQWKLKIQVRLTTNLLENKINIINKTSRILTNIAYYHNWIAENVNAKIGYFGGFGVVDPNKIENELLKAVQRFPIQENSYFFARPISGSNDSY